MDERLSSFSSMGPSIIDGVLKPDVVAVGNKVASLLAPNSTLAASAQAARVPKSAYCSNPSACGSTPSLDYLYLSGTSMSAPMVAGAAALMIQNDAALRPAWTASGQTFVPDTIKARIMKTATKPSAFPASFTATDSAGVVRTVFHNVRSMGAGYLDLGAAMKSRDTMRVRAASPQVRKKRGVGV